MPDIPNRSDRETQVESLLRRAIGRTRQELLDALGSPPDVNNIPDSLWDKIRQDVTDDTRRVIAIMLLLSIRRMNDLHGDDFTMPPADAARRAAEYAEKRAATLADSVVDTYRDRLSTAVTEAKTRIDAGEARSTVERDLRRKARDIGADQATNGGVTETTAANSAGEMSYADDYEDETGVKLIATWHTENDGDVCEVCEPLDDTTDEDWRDDFEDGPPAHPRCRCWLTFAPAEVSADMEA